MDKKRTRLELGQLLMLFF